MFAAAYLDYARYLDPDTGRRCDLERVLEHLELQRDMFERNRGQVFCFGFRVWKRNYVRAYLRSLRRYLVRLGSGYPDVPAWAAPAIPTCLAEFGLQLPCSEEELKAAYRERVKRSHPDRGGDRRRFLKLQQHFEQALALVREEQSSANETTRGRTTTYDAPPGRRTSRGE